MLWDLFCRVVDNFGDAGVCWRLASDLAARGQSVRLWIDDAAVLGKLAPEGADRVTVHPWPAPDLAVQPGDIVIEAFGCDPPAGFVGAMARSTSPPLWINLEYLSAEAYVERSHGLPSPQLAGPGAGLTKWFFYPGFTPATGGLLREPGLLDEREDFDGRAWLSARGWAPAPGQRVVSLFCYGQAPVGAVCDRLANEPLLLLAAEGAAQQEALAWKRQRGSQPGVDVIALPWLSQPEYDHLLWSCDLNFVRGEDSFVRAMWAGVPFVWNIYPQEDGVHAAKLQAFLDRFCAGAPASSTAAVASLFLGWNQLAPLPSAWPEADGWLDLCRAWRGRLASQPDLATGLMRFCSTHGKPCC